MFFRRVSLSRRTCASLLAAAASLAGATSALAATPYPLAWSVQAGTPAYDYVGHMKLDGNAIFLAGDTYGNLAGTNAGARDAVLLKYNTSGTLLWSWQYGTAGDDYSMGVDTDASGNIYVSGHSTGAMGGPVNNSSFIYKLNSAGSVVWQTQMTPSSSINYIFSSVVDPVGNSYHGGRGATGFLIKYDNTGNEAWRRNIGSLQGTTYEVAFDNAGNLLTAGDLNTGTKWDGMLAKYDSAGNQLWLRQISTPTGSTYARGTASDQNGNVYVVGTTSGAVTGTNFGNHDAFFAKYDPLGNLLWVRQYGTGEQESANAVTVDNDGHVFVTGSVTLGGAISKTNLRSYDSDGNLLWNSTFNGLTDWGVDLAADGAGNLFLASVRTITIGDPNMYLAEFFTNVPEPGALGLLALPLASFLLRRRRTA